jgi:hypothetical protein
MFGEHQALLDLRIKTKKRGETKEHCSCKIDDDLLEKKGKEVKWGREGGHL